MNIKPEIWGPHAWNFLHRVGYTFPDNPTDQEVTAAYNFFSSLKYLLPCQKCRFNYSSHLENFPLTVHKIKTPGKLADWLVDIHNEVNIMTGKPIVSYEQARELYLPKQTESNGLSGKQILIILIIIVACVLIYIKCSR